MNCHRARMALIEKDLGELALGHERALDEHLHDCGECRAHAVRESLLVDDLRMLRAAEPPRTDVRFRVMQELSTRPVVETLAVPQRQLAWSAAFAVTAAVAVAIGMRPHLGWLWQTAGKGVDASAAILSAAISVAASLRDLLVLPLRVLTAMEQSFAALSSSLGSLEPVLATGISVCLLSMMLTIAWVVLNDFRRPVRRTE